MTKKMQITIPLPDDIKKKDRARLFGDIIERIRSRTEEGFDFGGSRWRGKAGKYTKGYLNSTDFKATGKSPQPVNLTLSGDMIISLDVIDDKGKAVVIGFEKGDENAGKAEGNHFGTYGKPEPIAGKARPFLGFVKKEVDTLARIITEYSDVGYDKIKDILKRKEIKP